MNKLSGKYPSVIKWVVAVAVVLLLLPELLRIALVHTITSQGIGDVDIDDIDLNLFTGQLSVEQLTLSRDDKKTLQIGYLAVNIAWLQLLLGEVSIETLLVENTHLTALQHDDGTWDVVVPLPVGPQQQGVDQVDSHNEAALRLPRLALQQLLMRDVVIIINSPLANAEFVIDKLAVNDVSSWQEISPSLEVAARWNDAPLALYVTGEPLAVEPDFQAQIKIQRFPLNSIAGALGQTLTGVLNLDLSLNGQRKQHGIMESTVNGSVAVDRFTMQYGPLNIHHQQLLWQPDVNASLTDGLLAYRVGGDIQSLGLSVVDNKQNVSLLSWDKLLLSTLFFDHELNAGVGQLSIQAIDAVNNITSKTENKQQGSLYTGSLTGDKLVMTQGTSLSVDQIVLTDAQYQVLVQPDGAVQLSALLQSVMSDLNHYHRLLATEPVAAPSPLPETDNNFLVAVNTFSVKGDSFIALQDLRFSVPVKEKIVIEQLTVQNIDQLQTDQPMSIALVGRIGEFSTMQIGGELTPFAVRPSASLTGKLQAVALPSLSPYSEAYLGYHLTTGQYDHQFDMTVDNDVLSVKNQLQLRKLTLSAVDPNTPQPITRQLDVPLELAMDMLRDSQDNIALDVPIEGRLDDPSISIHAVVTEALGYALKNGATNYLKYAIQPYGAVIMAAQLVGDHISAIALDPIVYRAGDSQITQEHTVYIGKVSTLMLERPKLTLTLCGQANTKDKRAIANTVVATETGVQQTSEVVSAIKPATDQQLVALAEHRAVQLKRLLIDSGVDDQRVFLCQPQFQPDAINGVTMSM